MHSFRVYIPISLKHIRLFRRTLCYWPFFFFFFFKHHSDHSVNGVFSREERKLPLPGAEVISHSVG